MFDSLLSTDSLLHRSIKSKDDQTKLHEDLTKLEHWADMWGMKFIQSKCSMVRPLFKYFSPVWDRHAR